MKPPEGFKELVLAALLGWALGLSFVWGIVAAVLVLVHNT